MTKITESQVEELAIKLLETQGWQYVSPEKQEAERVGLSEVVLKERLRAAIDRLNPDKPAVVREQALKAVLGAASQNLVEGNERFHRMLTEGIDAEFLAADGVRGNKVWLVDFEHPENNDFVVCNQFTVQSTPTPPAFGHLPSGRGGREGSKRPDIVLFVNGLPLVVMELKNPADENATVKKAFTQLQNYKTLIPSLFHYNALLVASDGLDAKAGSLTADWSRFLAWKTVDGEKESSSTVPQLETLIRGLLRRDVLLDMVRHFTVFQKMKREDTATGQTFIETVKIVAAYHQYWAIRKALVSTLRATSHTGDRKAGVVWHTQGSGKSLSMVFYTGKAVLELDNPTIVVITDRNDLDDQLFEAFVASKQLLRQEPVQAENREHLKELLKTAGGGIVFTTIQKFFPEDGGNVFDTLSDRRNIIVMADEAHRSQYGFAAKTVYEKDETGKEVGTKTMYGFAKYLRDALPHASFIGFTGTPVEKEDASTPAVFGDYIDIYDIAQAVEDGATVRIYYESRLAKIHLKPEEKEQLDAEVESITEGEESTAKEKAKARWTQLEAIVGHPDRIREVAKDIVEHFEKRQEVMEGKGMIVAMSRRIAVALYEEIVKLRPEWHSSEKNKGALKVIMTSTSSDPEEWQMHNTTKQERKEIAERFKDPGSPLKLVIVRDMWLTGFDVPCLHTMYIDKVMQGHNLMQAIARVNRVFKDKPGGLIVDYIGIASNLKHALATYSANGGKGAPTFDQNEAIVKMLEKYEVVAQMFNGFDYRRYFVASTAEKLVVILEAQDYVLSLPDGKNRFVQNVDALSKVFALSVPSLEAMRLKDEVGFFQAVKARLVKFEPQGSGRSDEEIETAIRQIVDRAVVADGIVDVFDAAGIKKPDISILSDEFLEEVRGMERKNLALELLKKILNDEIKTRSKKNLIQSRKLSEMLEKAIKKYQNNLITAAQVIEELINLAKDIRAEDQRLEVSGLSEDEIAFYDALADNGSAKEVLGDDQLRELARVLVQRVKANTSIDWMIKESVQAKLRVIVKRVLREYGYPPDMEKLATENVLKQAEMLAEDWVELPVTEIVYN
jgi:type I restriction enzyme R subunit